MQLQARISIIKESGDSSFYYTSDLEEIRKLGLKYNGASFENIKIGTKITIEGEVYTVKNLEVKIYSDTDNAYGTPLNRAGKGYPYNLKITLIV